MVEHCIQIWGALGESIKLRAGDLNCLTRMKTIPNLFTVIGRADEIPDDQAQCI
jgi:hypothetical protein